MSDAEEPDVGCGQVQSVRTLGIGVEARVDDGEGGNNDSVGRQRRSGLGSASSRSRRKTIKLVLA